MPRNLLRPTVLIAAAGIALALGGCSSGSGGEPVTSSSPTVTASPTSSGGGESTVAFDKTIQQELIDVGCYAGSVDGIIGPETDAAIVAFQEASGLEVDGELGPETDAALKAAAGEGKKVCSGSSPTSSPTQAAGAACTATSISAALKEGETLNSYVCHRAGDEHWAAGSQSAGPEVTNFFLKAENGQWTLVPNDEVCGGASAGLPPAILDYCGLT